MSPNSPPGATTLAPARSPEAALASLKGRLLAWDPVAQREVWRVEHGAPWNGGVLVTAGDLVFEGTAAKPTPERLAGMGVSIEALDPRDAQTRGG